MAEKQDSRQKLKVILDTYWNRHRVVCKFENKFVFSQFLMVAIVGALQML